MHITREERGATLVEAIVAGGLLVTLATGTATLITLGRRLGGRAEQLMAATVIASARVQALRAIPWQYDLTGAAREVPALEIAPAGVLDRNTTGYVSTADEAGREVAAPGAAAPAYVVRWGVWPAVGVPGDARLIEVCVFVWPAAAGAPPLVCLHSARVRQP